MYGELSSHMSPLVMLPDMEPDLRIMICEEIAHPSVNKDYLWSPSMWQASTQRLPSGPKKEAPALDGDEESDKAVVVCISFEKQGFQYKFC